MCLISGGPGSLEQEVLKSGDGGGGGFGHKSAGVGEMDLGVSGEACEIDPGGVVVARKSIARAAPVGIDQGDGFAVQTLALEKQVEAAGGFVGQGVGAGQEEDFGGAVGKGEGPDLGMIPEEVEAGAEGFQVIDEVLADHAHDFPDRVAGFEEIRPGEPAEKGDVDGGVELIEDLAFDAEPLGGGMRAAAVEPFGGFEPITKHPGVLVEAKVLEDKGEGAGGGVVLGKMVMVEVVAVGVVEVSHIHHAECGIVQVVRGGFPTVDGHGMLGEQEAAGEKFVFVGSPGVGEDGVDVRHKL